MYGNCVSLEIDISLNPRYYIPRTIRVVRVDLVGETMKNIPVGFGRVICKIYSPLTEKEYIESVLLPPGTHLIEQKDYLCGGRWVVMRQVQVSVTEGKQTTVTGLSSLYPTKLPEGGVWEK